MPFFLGAKNTFGRQTCEKSARQLSILQGNREGLSGVFTSFQIHPQAFLDDKTIRTPVKPSISGQLCRGFSQARADHAHDGMQTSRVAYAMMPVLAWRKVRL